MGDPNLFLHISSGWVEISMRSKFQPPRLPRSGVPLVEPPDVIAALVDNHSYG